MANDAGPISDTLPGGHASSRVRFSRSFLILSGFLGFVGTHFHLLGGRILKQGAEDKLSSNLEAHVILGRRQFTLKIGLLCWMAVEKFCILAVPVRMKAVCAPSINA
jgi:hypothetical protein